MKIDFALALHVLGCLTAKSETPVSSDFLASTFGTSPVVVRRLLTKLKAAGLVQTQRGVGGGTILARPPSEISLLDAFHAVSEDHTLLRRHPSTDSDVGEVIGDFINDLFASLEADLFEQLDAVSVAELDAEVRPKIIARLYRKDRKPN
ncbi:MAG: Rrf2 family transcriptional regulator [Verrucomicrobiota bacterium]